MSVYSGNRSESKMEFLNNAHELELMTVKLSVRENAIPKRYRLILGKPLTDSARIVNQNVIYANSIYPKTKAEYELRKQYQKRASIEMKNLLELMRITSEIIPMKENVLSEWVRMASLEDNLIKKWMQSDKQRYKDLI